MLIAVAIVIVLGLSGLRVAQEYQRGVIFRLGRTDRMDRPVAGVLNR